MIVRLEVNDGYMEYQNSVAATLRQIGKDERWLQEWIIEDPKRSALAM